MATVKLGLELVGSADGAPVEIVGAGSVDPGTGKLALEVRAARSLLLFDPTLVALWLLDVLALVAAWSGAVGDEADPDSHAHVRVRTDLYDENGREAGGWRVVAALGVRLSATCFRPRFSTVSDIPSRTASRSGFSIPSRTSWATPPFSATRRRGRASGRISSGCSRTCPRRRYTRWRGGFSGITPGTSPITVGSAACPRRGSTGRSRRSKGWRTPGGLSIRQRVRSWSPEHIGNWELGALYFAWMGLQVNVVVLPDNAPQIDAIRESYRSRYSIRTIAMDGSPFATSPPFPHSAIYGNQTYPSLLCRKYQ